MMEDEEFQKYMDKLVASAWNHSRPHPQEAEFSEMTPLFRERVRAFSVVFINMIAQDNVVKKN